MMPGSLGPTRRAGTSGAAVQNLANAPLPKEALLSVQKGKSRQRLANGLPRVGRRRLSSTRAIAWASETTECVCNKWPEASYGIQAERSDLRTLKDARSSANSLSKELADNWHYSPWHHELLPIAPRAS